MTDKKVNSNKVHCDVSECVYNNHECGCEAQEIKVSPMMGKSEACSSDDTVCATFAPSEEDR